MQRAHVVDLESCTDPWTELRAGRALLGRRGCSTSLTRTRREYWAGPTRTGAWRRAGPCDCTVGGRSSEAACRAPHSSRPLSIALRPVRAPALPFGWAADGRCGERGLPASASRNTIIREHFSLQISFRVFLSKKNSFRVAGRSVL